MNTPTITESNCSEFSLTRKFLMQNYGPTLTLDELSFVLKRKPGGVRAALAKNIETWAITLNSRRVVLGRRVLFPVGVVAELITGETPEKGLNK